MKTLTRLIVCTLAFGLSSPVIAQGKVEIEWDKPEKYRDVRPSNESRKRFREATFKRIDEYMNMLAAELPDNSKLLMTVSDLDLAGEVFPASFVGLGHSSSDVRVIKNIDIPRMKFSYQLLDEAGQVLKESDVNLKDMSFLDRSNNMFRNEPLRFEKNMLKRWFAEEFESHLVQKGTDKEPAIS